MQCVRCDLFIADFLADADLRVSGSGVKWSQWRDDMCLKEHATPGQQGQNTHVQVKFSAYNQFLSDSVESISSIKSLLFLSGGRVMEGRFHIRVKVSNFLNFPEIRRMNIWNAMIMSACNHNRDYAWEHLPGPDVLSPEAACATTNLFGEPNAESIKNAGKQIQTWKLLVERKWNEG